MRTAQRPLVALGDSLLALDDHAQTHLATLGTPPDTNDPAWRAAITIEQLASHSAGFEKDRDAPELVSEPGTRWE